MSNSTAATSRTFEGLLLIVLLSFGIYGIFSYFNSSEDKGVDISSFSQNNYEALFIENNTETPELPSLRDRNSFLAIDGLAEAGTIMSFSIENFNKETNYELDFGNGSKKKINGGSTKYIYEAPGNYEVKLIASYNGKSKVLQSENLTINKNMALVMN